MKKKRCLVIGNCQVKSLAHTLNYFSEDVDFDHFQVHSVPAHKIEQYIGDRVAIEKDKLDFILAFQLSDVFHGVSSSRISDSFPGTPIFRINNLFFAGYHPDIVVLGGMGKRMDGPLDQYRSRIALYGYVSDWSVERTCSLYNDEQYRLLNYYDTWEQSQARLLEGSKTVDIQFADEYCELLKKRLCMFVLNHPTPIVFRAWAECIIKYLASKSIVKARNWNPDEALLPAYFDDTAAFPVYPEIVEKFSLQFPGSYLFKTKGFGHDSFLDLEQFVRREFLSFAEAGREALKAAPQWEAVAKQFSVLP